jgi:hypothetical protein
MIAIAIPSTVPQRLRIITPPTPHRRRHRERATMVFYFTSTAVDPPANIYVGKDKVESMPASKPFSIRSRPN